MRKDTRMRLLISLLLACALSACIEPHTTEACTKMCGTSGVKELNFTTCVCKESPFPGIIADMKVK